MSRNLLLTFSFLYFLLLSCFFSFFHLFPFCTELWFPVLLSSFIFIYFYFHLLGIDCHKCYFLILLSHSYLYYLFPYLLFQYLLFILSNFQQRLHLLPPSSWCFQILAFSIVSCIPCILLLLFLSLFHEFFVRILPLWLFLP